MASPGPDLGDVEAQAPPLETAPEHGDVAAVGVDVHLVRIQVTQPHRRGSRHYVVLPEGRDDAAAYQLGAEVEHGGVGGQHVCGAAEGRGGHQGVEGPGGVAYDVDAVALEPAVAEAQRQVLCPVAGDDEVGEVIEERFVVDVPDPRRRHGRRRCGR